MRQVTIPFALMNDLRKNAIMLLGPKTSGLEGMEEGPIPCKLFVRGVKLGFYAVF